MSDELLIIVLLIIYIVLVMIMLAIGGVKMMKNVPKAPFTQDQVKRLNECKGNPERYHRLRTQYLAMNSCPYKGRVIGMDGTVLHEGYKVVDGGKK